MRTLYVSVLVVHVLIAVLGIGLIGAVAVIARAARRSAAPTDVASWLRPLLRYFAFSLLAMLITGLLLNFAVGGAFSAKWWFRGSFLLLVATGALHAQARRALRSSLAPTTTPDPALRRVERIAYAMCALVAAITVLMEAKPF